jgi:predicted metal-binding membrane protein
MTEALLEVLLRRDRIIVAVALAALTALAWAYVLWLAADMGMAGMDMTGFRMIPAGMGIMVPAPTPWQAIEFAYAFAMWAVMMVGMMTPSAAPMILIYARVGRQASAQGKPFAATGWFATGYLLTWAGFSLVATVAQWALERTALLDCMMAGTSQVFGGIVLITAGVYQWSPLKDTCLAQCQSPLLFIHRHGGFHRDPSASLALGLRHGAHCVGCCWALMALLFVGGVMNVLWIATISAFVLIEKIVPVGRLISRIAGLGFVAAGAWIVVASS